VRPECIPGSEEIKNASSDSDSILAEASPNLGSAQLIPYLKYYFNEMIILVRPEFIPVSVKTKNEIIDGYSSLT